MITPDFRPLCKAAGGENAVQLKAKKLGEYTARAQGGSTRVLPMFDA